jgi:hypothetical protein
MESLDFGSTSSKKRETTTWSKEERIGDTCKSITVEKVENGFVITKYKSWQDPEKGYQSESKKIISKENPLDDDEGFLGKLTDSVEIE